MSQSPHLLVERDGHVVILTMNRPEARNAFGSEMLVRLCDAWDLVDGDRSPDVAPGGGVLPDFPHQPHHQDIPLQPHGPGPRRLRSSRSSAQHQSRRTPRTRAQTR